MHPVRNGVIEGFDQYLNDLRSDESGETLVSVTAFDTSFYHWHIGEPIAAIPPSISGRYVPSGMTALWDAIAFSLIDTDKKLRELGRQDMKVLHVTITDGGENSSSDYSRNNNGQARLAALVKEYENLSADERASLSQAQKDELVGQRVIDGEPQGTWTFSYLGAGEDDLAGAQATATGMGYSPGNAMYFAATMGGVRNTTNSLGKATVMRRSSSSAVSASLFADAGQSAEDYADPGVEPNATLIGGMTPAVVSTPPAVKPKPAAKAKPKTGLEGGSLSDLLGK